LADAQRRLLGFPLRAALGRVTTPVLFPALITGRALVETAATTAARRAAAVVVPEAAGLLALVVIADVLTLPRLRTRAAALVIVPVASRLLALVLVADVLAPLRVAAGLVRAAVGVGIPATAAILVAIVAGRVAAVVVVLVAVIALERGLSRIEVEGFLAGVAGRADVVRFGPGYATKEHRQGEHRDSHHLSSSFFSQVLA